MYSGHLIRVEAVPKSLIFAIMKDLDQLELSSVPNTFACSSASYYQLISSDNGSTGPVYLILRPSSVCNGVIDCPEGDDEDYLTCNTSPSDSDSLEVYGYYSNATYHERLYKTGELTPSVFRSIEDVIEVYAIRNTGKTSFGSLFRANER